MDCVSYNISQMLGVRIRTTTHQEKELYSHDVVVVTQVTWTSIKSLLGVEGGEFVGIVGREDQIRAPVLFFSSLILKRNPSEL